MIKGKVLTINNTKYLLLEFSYTYEIDISEIVYNLQLNGYKVIIAHIERYEALSSHRAHIEELVDMGAYMQVNAASIEGKLGLLTKHKVIKWIKSG